MNRNVFAILLLTGLALLGSTVLLALHIDVPEFLSFVVVTGFGALAGAAVPSSSAAADASRRDLNATTRSAQLEHASTEPAP